MPGATANGLALLLPAGTDRYVGLFTVKPTPDGDDGTEVAVTGYARVAIDAWTPSVDGGAAKRANTSAVEFAGFDFPATLSIVAVGIWDTLTLGDCLAYLEITPIEDGLAASDQLRFPAGTLALFGRP